MIEESLTPSHHKSQNASHLFIHRNENAVHTIGGYCSQSRDLTSRKREGARFVGDLLSVFTTFYYYSFNARLSMTFREALIFWGHFPKLFPVSLY